MQHGVPNNVRQLPTAAPQRKRFTRAGAGALLVLLLVVLVAGGGIGSRMLQARDLRARTAERAVPTVATIRASRGPSTEELVLPGNVQAYVEAPIYARTSGYVRKWYTDLGAHVHAGDLLAELETPEVDDQLRQTDADLRTAEANDELAQTTATRWRSLMKQDAVSRQETDEKNGDANAKRAMLQSARANHERLQNLQGFKRVVAPFDGVISARRTDIGQLINAGSGVGPELFRIVDTSRLRVYVQVPQPYTAALHVGGEAVLRFAERPGRDFPAKLVRMSDALDPASRSLQVELETDNKSGELFAGSYADVHFKLGTAESTLRVPVSAVLFRADGLSVAKVDDAGKVTLQKVTTGRDFGSEIEITTGLQANDQIALSPPDSMRDGQVVHIAGAPAGGGESPAAAGRAADASAPSPRGDASR
ncbi:MAG: mdtA [Rhodospirillales bacterium]|nr:mdtA [Rhodospirillales bacterium]